MTKYNGNDLFFTRQGGTDMKKPNINIRVTELCSRGTMENETAGDEGEGIGARWFLNHVI
jgi:hypothetical protein